MSDLRTGVSTLLGAPTTLVPVKPSSYRIYKIRHRASGRHYVGLTSRTVPARTRAHVYQSRRSGDVRVGGLLEAIRLAEAEGLSFDEAFDVAELTSTEAARSARELERSWIDWLDAAWPIGFNLMPGGASIGGRGNAVAVTAKLPDGGERTWPTIGDAIAQCNVDLHLAGQPLLSPSSVYARITAGWRVEEALGLVPHTDGRSLRTPVCVGGQAYATLREASQRIGITPGALRSRAHRRGQHSASDMALDRRLAPSAPADIAITWLQTGERITAAEFARRMNLPKATVLARWQQAVRMGFDMSEPEEVTEWLCTAQDRRVVIALHLPDGQIWSGGQREVIRTFLASPWERQRPRRLGESGIRRRLRKLGPARLADPEDVLWAFGFLDAFASGHA